MGEIERFKHDPVGLLQDVAEKMKGENLRAAAVVVVDNEGRLMWDGASYQKMELLWALEKFKYELLFGD